MPAAPPTPQSVAAQAVTGRRPPGTSCPHADAGQVPPCRAAMRASPAVHTATRFLPRRASSCRAAGEAAQPTVPLLVNCHQISRAPDLVRLHHRNGDEFTVQVDLLSHGGRVVQGYDPRVLDADDPRSRSVTLENTRTPTFPCSLLLFLQHRFGHLLAQRVLAVGDKNSRPQAVGNRRPVGSSR